MPDKKLSLSHKLAGVIDRLIKASPVRDLDLVVFNGVNSDDLNIEAKTLGSIPYINAKCSIIDCLSPQITEIIEDLQDTKTYSISLSEINTSVKSEEFKLIHSNDILDVSTSIEAETKDIFKKFNISSKLSYSTKIQRLDIIEFKPKVQSIRKLKYSRVLDNYYLIKKCSISKKSALFSFLSQKEQLTYWRKAVLQTKRDPKDLELIGVYYKVPYYNIEKFNIDFNKRTLSYVLKENAVAKKINFCNIIIFRDIIKKKGIIIEV